MEKKLQPKEFIFVGSLLFGLFFGAGNLIFPVNLGQQAGSNVWLANLGFLITGVGLPFLGVIAIGVSGQKGILAVSKRIGRRYGTFFTVALYLVIGPFFAMPRLASTSFEIALAPFLPTGINKWALLAYSIIFFVGAYCFARRPAKLLNYIGKFLNPLFLVLLSVIIIFSFVSPMGGIQNVAPTGAYVAHPFITGLKEGYNTLDVLASLAFGIIIVTTIKQMGVKSTAAVTKDTLKSGTVGIALMAVIYTCLSTMGTKSLGALKLSANGGIALAQIANHYLGSFGSIILALIVIVACLKTAIGLTTAFSETFTVIFPKVSYKKWLVIVSILPAIFANVGLTKIISAAVPVLMFIYPLAIAIVSLVITGPLFKQRQVVYIAVTVCTFVAALLDGLNAAPDFIRTLAPIAQLLSWAQHIPLFDLGMSGLIFIGIGFIVGGVLSLFFKKSIAIETR